MKKIVLFPLGLLLVACLLYVTFAPQNVQSKVISIESQCGIPRAIKRPAFLSQTTRFESSALLWVDELQRYLVVSDDTGTKNKSGMPWLFTMDQQGNLDPSIVTVTGVSKIKDMESITRDDKGFIYLLSSQSINQNGKVKPSRTYFIKAQLKGHHLQPVKSIHFRPILKKLIKNNPIIWRKLGLTSHKLRDLNIEGVTWHKGALYFGLENPRDTEGRALIWVIKNPDQLFATETLAENDISLFARIPLVDSKGKSLDGISDLLFLSDDRLILLTGKRHQGFIMVVHNAGHADMDIQMLARCDDINPEGISLNPNKGKDWVTIVFDQGKKKSMWAELQIR
jgi:hypothetical protein